MMAGELVDPVKATKLLVFMCLDCPSPWGHYIRSGGGGAQLAELHTHADAGSPPTTKTNVAQLPPTPPGCRVFRMPRSSCGCLGSSDGGEQGEDKEKGERRMRRGLCVWASVRVEGLSAKMKELSNFLFFRQNKIYIRGSFM